jgi:hypothetical protein
MTTPAGRGLISMPSLYWTCPLDQTEVNSMKLSDGVRVLLVTVLVGVLLALHALYEKIERIVQWSKKVVTTDGGE